MVEFKSRSDSVEIHFHHGEADLLRSLLEEMRTFLTADIPREDPVVTRIFPDVHENQEDAEAYRELVGDQLRTSKLDAVTTVAKTMESVTNRATIPRVQIDTWLTALTDMRLAIGTRLEVTEEKMSIEPDSNDPEAPALTVLHWLGWMQESLLRCITSVQDE
jgi:hypothetical protein